MPDHGAERELTDRSRRDILPWQLLDDLRCAYCSGALDAVIRLNQTPDGLTDGVLKCECCEYPVVGGIAVLRQIGSVSSTRNEAVERLRRGDVDGATEWLLEEGCAPGVPRPSSLKQNRSVWKRAMRRVRRRGGPSKRLGYAGPIPLREGFHAALRGARTAGYADYLYQRFANLSLLGALPALLVLGAESARTSRRRVLDILSGVGHTSAMLTSLFPALDVVEADGDFVNLFISRKLTAPGVSTLCIDAELPLPFRSGTVDGLFCLDGLHYVRSKSAFIREVDRIISDSGVWAFAHLHNALVHNVNPGAPLSPESYAERFAFGEQRLLSERAVVDQFEAAGSLDLSEQPSLDTLSGSNALTLIGARTGAAWHRHAGLDEFLATRSDVLGFNPLYRITPERGGGAQLDARWPSAALRVECADAAMVLPQTAHIPASLLNELAAGPHGPPVSPEIRTLVRSFVLVPTPVCYRDDRRRRDVTAPGEERAS